MAHCLLVDPPVDILKILLLLVQFKRTNMPNIVSNVKFTRFILDWFWENQRNPEEGNPGFPAVEGQMGEVGQLFSDDIQLNRHLFEGFLAPVSGVHWQSTEQKVNNVVLVKTKF